MADGKVARIPLLQNGLACTEVNTDITDTTTYTCPYDGWYVINITSTGANTHAYIRIGDGPYIFTSGKNTTMRRMIFPFRAGTVLKGRSGSSYTQTVVRYFRV